jgi:2-keto-3-deoxy-L-rhamnonate aldolase RhmA
VELILITNDVSRASIAQDAGVDHVMLDLEINGKVERQGHLNTVISRHTFQDIENVRRVLKATKLLVRVNPIFEESEAEVDKCVELGADAIMLPMFTHPSEVESFVKLVRGRSEAWLLLETPQALVRCRAMLDIDGIDAVHIGLNDLHLGLGLNFMFEPLGEGVIDWVAKQISTRGAKLGIGGVARLQGGLLSAGLILSEHVRLKSSQVILSRDFLKIFDLPAAEARRTFKEEVSLLRSEVQRLQGVTGEELMDNHRTLQKLVRQIANSRRQASGSASPGIH